MLLLKYFRCDVVGCATYGSAFLVLEFELGGKTKVACLHLHLVVDEEIAQFQVAMDHAVLVHVLDGLQDLLGVALHLKLTESLAALDLLVEGGVAADLHDYVNVLLVFKEVFELDDVRVVHRAVDSNLTLQLLLRSRLSQRSLRDYLDCLDIV